MFVRKDGLQYAAETGAITIGPNPSFIKNFAYSETADAYGGVIYSDGDISFSDGGMFTGNYAKTSGGAITMGGKCDLLALTKDALFGGNMTGGVFTRHEDGTFSVENGVANAIDMNGSLFSSLYTPNLTLAAEERREIRFNDPITSRNEDPGRPMTLTLNRYTDGEGNVRDTDSAANSTREKIRILPPAGTTASSRMPPSMAAPSCWNTMLSSAGILRK